MEFLACIFSIVSCIYPPLRDALQSCLGTQAEHFFSHLTDWVVRKFNTRAVEELPVSCTSIEGAEETLDEIRTHLSDDSVGIIGIYGMGGVGKTTLLQKINNDFFESGTRGKFDLVIWATVSKDVDIPKIQKQIGDRLGLSVSEDKVKNAKTLFQALSPIRFLVLLDDLWAKLDLVEVGIPVPNKQRNRKIAFTTRSLDVCTDMDAENVRVKTLDDASSWKLFYSKLRTDVVLNNLYIRQLAEQAVRKCGGLPLALITVGRAMANRNRPSEWEDAIRALDHSAEKLGDMEDQVLSCLKFSYDYLKNDKMRSALLFCAMFPEDTDIPRKELIEYWIGEGLLDDDDVGIDVARNRGDILISNLQDSCMLEAGINDAEETVRMHDAVRDLALWLNRTEAVDGFIGVDEDLTKVTNIQRLKHVRRILMYRSELKTSHSPIPIFPECWTLLLIRSCLEPCLLRGFFNCMRTLRVLDFSKTHLKELPIEIGLLENLKYLQLSKTNIMSLPKELGNLVKLRQLVLEDTDNLRNIPREAIVGLSSLQVLNMCESGYDWETPGSSSDSDAEGGSGGRQLELSDLEGLNQLQDLRIDLYSSTALGRLWMSDTLCRCTRRLLLRENSAHPWAGELRISLDQLPCLEELQLGYFRSGRTTTIVLEGTNPKSGSSNAGVLPWNQRFQHLSIFYSRGLKELTLLGRFLCLQGISLGSCIGMEELLLDDDDGIGIQQGRRQEELLDSHFPMLKSISLYAATELKRIGPQPLFLPSLETIYVSRCPQLRRLPLGPGSAPKLREIRGDKEWWDALEWGSSDDDNHNIQSIFAPFFIPHK